MNELINVKLSKTEEMVCDDTTISSALKRQQEIYRKAMTSGEISPFFLEETIKNKNDKARLGFLDEAYCVEKGLKLKYNGGELTSNVMDAIESCNSIVDLLLKQIDAQVSQYSVDNADKDLKKILSEKTMSSFNISDFMKLFEKKYAFIMKQYKEATSEDKEKIEKMLRAKKMTSIPTTEEDIKDIVNERIRSMYLVPNSADRLIKSDPNILRICTKFMKDEEIASIYKDFFENRENYWSKFIDMNNNSSLDLQTIRELNTKYENLGLESGGSTYQEQNKECMERRLTSEHADLQYKFILAIADARSRDKKGKLNNKSVCMQYFEEDLLEGAKKKLEIVEPNKIAKRDFLSGLGNSEVKGNFFVNLIKRIFGQQER